MFVHIYHDLVMVTRISYVAILVYFCIWTIILVLESQSFISHWQIIRLPCVWLRTGCSRVEQRL
jgi:hypothetical protein